MNKDKSQIKITIPSNTKNLLKERASQMGVTISTYVKLLVFSDIKYITYPTFFPTIKELDKLVREYKD
jgi:antitoxin component of RelBE/YafQ-DinJ toxin-antitoxin module